MQVRVIKMLVRATRIRVRMHHSSSIMLMRLVVVMIEIYSLESNYKLTIDPCCGLLMIVLRLTKRVSRAALN